MQVRVLFGAPESCFRNRKVPHEERGRLVPCRHEATTSTVRGNVLCMEWPMTDVVAATELRVRFPFYPREFWEQSQMGRQGVYTAL